MTTDVDICYVKVWMSLVDIALLMRVHLTNDFARNEIVVLWLATNPNLVIHFQCRRAEVVRVGSAVRCI